MLVGTALGSHASSDVSLKVGDPAPLLRPAKWLKGEQVSQFENGMVYLIDFWATWCSPCIREMPHLSALAEKYRDKLVVVAVNTLEAKGSASVDPQYLQSFVDRKGDKMAFRVAMDDQKNTTFGEWVTASGLMGIPNTFIVDQQGRLAWVGYPGKVDQPLEQIMSGSFDVSTARKKQIATAESNRKRKESELQLQPMFDAIRRNDYRVAKEEADKLIKQDPKNETRYFWVILNVRLRADVSEALEYICRTSEDPAFLEAMGMTGQKAPESYVERVAINTAQLSGLPRKAYEFAVIHLESSLRREQDYFREDVLAQARASLGDLDAAIAGEERALALLDQTAQPGNEENTDMTREMIKERLIRYRELQSKK